MSNPYSRLWLAREQQVHGPYELAQLTEMDAHGELLPDDHFRRDDEEHWMNYEEWRASVRRRSVVKPSQRLLSHTERVTIDQKRQNMELTSHIRPRPSLSRVRLMQSVAPEEETPERRLARMVDFISDHRRTQGHIHPFHFMEERQIADVLVWLDYHHPLWDCRALESTTSNIQVEILDKWLIPALAKVFPDLVKSSHSGEFGPGRRWHLA